MSSEFLLRFHQETGPRSGSSWCSIVAFLLCVLVCVYAIFPSESSSERLSLFVRLGFLCLMAVLAILFGEVRRELVWIFCGLAFYYVFVIVWSNSPYFTPRLVNLVASILCAALVIGSTASGRASAFALRVVGGLLVFSAAALFLQAGIYLFSGSIFEMHGLVFPWGISRSSEIERFGIARLSGLHTEPGTHSVYTVGLLILRCMLGGRLFDRTAYMSIGSVAATLSFWGVLATLLYVILYGFSIIRGGAGAKRFLYSCFFIGFLGLVFYLSSPQYLIDDLFNYFRLRSELGDGSGSAKVIAWDMGASRLGDVVFFGFPIGFDYCNACISPQDAGLVLNFVMYFGLMSAVGFFAIFIAGALRCGGLSLSLFGGLLLVAKFYYFDPIVWLMFFASAAWCFRRSIRF